MKKVYVHPPNENWIIDRFVKEWNEDNADISTTNPFKADVIWLLADFCWQKLLGTYNNPGPLQDKSVKVMTTIHHIVPEKFGWAEKEDFFFRDQMTTAYHVYNTHTHAYLKSLTEKPIHFIPYWANNKIWRPTLTKDQLRKKYKLPRSAFLIGSFQRDTEGRDLKSPKLEKGPDLFVDYVVRRQNEWKKLRSIVSEPPQPHVLLAGWRRQYVIKRLEEEGIEYTYFELPDHETVNELYQCLDLYPVTARYEGGPQALIECGLLNVPVVSRPVGIAEQVLPSSAIAFNLNVDDVKPAVPNVESWKLPMGYEPYRKLIQDL